MTANAQALIEQIWPAVQAQQTATAALTAALLGGADTARMLQNSERASQTACKTLKLLDELKGAVRDVEKASLMDAVCSDKFNLSVINGGHRYAARVDYAQVRNDDLQVVATVTNVVDAAEGLGGPAWPEPAPTPKIQPQPAASFAGIVPGRLRVVNDFAGSTAELAVTNITRDHNGGLVVTVSPNYATEADKHAALDKAHRVRICLAALEDEETPYLEALVASGATCRKRLAAESNLAQTYMQQLNEAEKRIEQLTAVMLENAKHIRQAVDSLTLNAKNEKI